MVIVLLDQAADTPVGRPVAVAIPMALVVVCVIDGDNAVFIITVGVDEGESAVFNGLTVIVPVALILPHPPVRGML